jgi:hypothetical protein
MKWPFFVDETMFAKNGNGRKESEKLFPFLLGGLSGDEAGDPVSDPFASDNAHLGDCIFVGVEIIAEFFPMLGEDLLSQVFDV